MKSRSPKSNQLFPLPNNVSVEIAISVGDRMQTRGLADADAEESIPKGNMPPFFSVVEEGGGVIHYVNDVW